MMRVIPKRTNVRLELFKGIEVMDVLVGAVGALIVISFAVSNLPAKFFFAIAMLAITVALVIPLGDEKGYMVVFASVLNEGSVYPGKRSDVLYGKAV